MLREIMTRLPDIEPVGSEVEFLASNFISGPSEIARALHGEEGLTEEGLGRGSLLLNEQGLQAIDVDRFDDVMIESRCECAAAIFFQPVAG